MANTKYVVEVSYQRYGDVTVMAESPEEAAKKAALLGRQQPNNIKSPTIDCDALVVNNEHGDLVMEI